ncbi:MAG: hypothetical protein HY421_03185 [Candidatus Kerfeldbacteria bacterium]|nr:hypothetical protein [Candidatus Kerfeldbacteria bacterium]
MVLSAAYFWVGPDTDAAVWKDPAPCTPPVDVSGCPISAPLNTSNSIQTKSGDLTLLEGLTIGNSDLIIGDSAPPDTPICWNGVCKSNWGDPSQAGNFVPLFNKACSSGCNADGYSFSSGFASIQAPTTALAAWRARASAPGVANTAGVLGVSHPTSSVSYGIFAQAGNDSYENAALFASAPAQSEAWAAYLAGDVRVAEPWDVVVGGSGLPAQNGVGELCINDECRRDWPPDGTGDAHWTENGSYYEVTETSYHLAVGSNGSGAPFFVETVPSQYNADLIVRGSGTTATAVGSTEGLTVE